MIFANHAHVYPTVLRENGDIHALKRLMFECGIDKCVAFAPFPERFKDSGLAVNHNVWLSKEIANDESLTGFGTLDFTRDDLAEQVELIASLGFKGLKLHPPAQDFGITDERAFVVYEKAQEHDLFISFHTGIHWSRLRENLPILYDEVAYHFPNLRFSMEHIGGYSFFNDALAVIVNNTRNGKQPRVFAGWTSIENARDGGAWGLTDEQLIAVVHQAGEDRSIFGIDFPFKNAKYITDSINRIKALPISGSAKEKILGGNLERELLPPHFND